MNESNLVVNYAATAPLILGISVNDIYMIGMLIIALLGVILPFIVSAINKSKVDKDEVKKALDDAKETIEKIKDEKTEE